MQSDKNTAERFVRIVLPSTTSTMDDARRLAGLHPCGVVRADYQSAGRGRLAGRSWSSEMGQGRSCTVWMTKERYAASAGQGGAPPPLAAGLALRRALLAWAESEGTSFRGGISLKWPNDLLCAERKLAGILCESAGASILMGFGVNLAQLSFAEGYRTAPSSVLLECGTAPDKDRLVDLLLEELNRPGGVSPAWLQEANDALAWRGRGVRFSPGMGTTAPVRGLLRGLDASGAVILLVDGRESGFVSGELRLDSY
jgi:BirA family transcriptional regulator, biotin operon repressor / biotin---[acetyl-CoA-carboxylase] ligase